MRKIIASLIVTIVFVSCSKTELEAVNPIIGEWKLVKAEQNDGANTIAITDYTKENIIYKFEANSNLNISSPSNNSRNYKYEYKKEYLSGFPSSGEQKISLVIIDNQKWTCEIANKKMILGKSYVDGPDLYLEKK